MELLKSPKFRTLAGPDNPSDAIYIVNLFALSISTFGDCSENLTLGKLSYANTVSLICFHRFFSCVFNIFSADSNSEEGIS